eukprot:TRINITY_DN7239_c0_g1_i1.p1 TRINITY_DN7239_c0_g1~~TRINITY_DN7239_c0_g1_i1.p1  ORF type:complete len:159 (+),score=26.61 TRINITY_DN7239_c0_g1_i1:382-858(+)
MCQELNQTLEEGLKVYCTILSDCEEKDFAHKLRLRWQSYRSSMLGYLQGMFLSLNAALAKDETLLSVQGQCMVAFRNHVLLAEPVMRKFETAVLGREEMVPRWLIQMVTELDLPRTNDLRQNLFRTRYYDPVNTRLLSEVDDARTKREAEELAVLGYL